MEGLQWLLWLVVPLGLLAALYLLDRLGLWLEGRGWLYYRKKKPTSSRLSGFVIFQEFIEPSVKHIRHIHKEWHDEDRETVRERLLDSLLNLLDATPVNVEEIRQCLADAKRAGLDWKQLYSEAVRVEVSTRPERARLIPSPEDVAPLQEPQQ